MSLIDKYEKSETVDIYKRNPDMDFNQVNHPINFKPYYMFVEKRFSTRKEGGESRLVGEYSNEEAYIDAYIKSHDCSNDQVLSYLDKWFCKKKYGTLLIYGEPGHGKSTLCDLAMVKYYRGTFLKDKAKNVLTVSLNTGENPGIINNGKVDIRKALSWGDEDYEKFTFSDCNGALLFMDGFDEFIDDAKKADITNIVSFMKKVDKIALKHDIHIVVLSRTIAIHDYLNETEIVEKCSMLLPITIEQQDDWLRNHNEYADYVETFKSIRADENMRELLGIPFLFRMIVHSRFDEISTNVVELYDRLTNHLLEKRNIVGKEEKSKVHDELCNLAYNIYCNDTDTVTFSDNKWNKRWIFAFYIKQTGKRIIGFFHRSFYQYFLARYIYNGLHNVNKNNVKEFIGNLAERELDVTTRQNLSLIISIINEKDKEIIDDNLNMVIDTLVETEAYLNLESKFPLGNAEKTKIGRTINVYRNTLHICAAFAYVIKKPFGEGIDVFLRLYPSNNITICSNKSKKANLTKTDLSGANLSGADLGGANLRRIKQRGASPLSVDLSRANLNNANFKSADMLGVILRGASLKEVNFSGANLSEADLSGANLSGANLNGVDLSGANLNGACLKEVNLNGAILSGADLSEANLTGAHLTKANLSGVNLSRATMNRANLSGADLSSANLNGASIGESDFSGANLTKAVLYKANLSGSHLKEAALIEANMNGANLSRAKLIKANISKAYLNGTKLNEIDLSEANLSNSFLSDANLSRANIVKANLSGVHLIEANLSGAFIIETSLKDANLSRANLGEAYLLEANFSGVDLSGADLRKANIQSTNLRVNNLHNAIIESDYKELIDTTIKGFESIIWVKKKRNH